MLSCSADENLNNDIVPRFCGAVRRSISSVFKMLAFLEPTIRPYSYGQQNTNEFC